MQFVTRQVDPTGVEAMATYDARGNRESSYNADPDERVDMVYTEHGQLLARLSPFDAQGRRRRDERSYFPDGSSVPHPSAGYLKSRTVDAGGLALTDSFTYDLRGNQKTYTDPDGFVSSYDYNDADLLIRETRPEVDGTPRVYDVIYDVKMLERSVHYSNFDALGQPDLDNPTVDVNYEYDSLGYEVAVLSEIEPGELKETRFVLDAERRDIEHAAPDQLRGANVDEIQGTIYDGFGRVHETVRAPGTPHELRTRYDYDLEGRVRRTTVSGDGKTREWTTLYNCFGATMEESDAMGNVRVNEFDEAGRLTRTQRFGELVDVPGGAANVLLTEEVHSYDALGRHRGTSTRHFDPATGGDLGDGWKVSEWDLDGHRRLHEMRDDHGESVSVGYDTAGRRDFVSGSDFEEIRSYDARGNLRSQTRSNFYDDGGFDVSQRSRDYDGLGQLTRKVDGRGSVREWKMNSRGDATLQFDGMRTAPDQRGNLVAHGVDGVRDETSVRFELREGGHGQGSLVDTIELGFDWDHSSRALAFRDPLGNQTDFGYDSRGNLERRTYPDTPPETMVYDAFGDLVRMTDSRGTIFDMSYDALGRLERVDLTPGPGVDASTSHEAFAYDGISRRVRASDDDSDVARRYDSLGNLLSETANGVTLGFEHDSEGELVSVEYSGGQTLQYARDIRGRITEITDDEGSVADFLHAGTRGLARVDFPGIGADSQWTYDAEGLVLRTLHRLGGTAVLDWNSVYDAQQRPTSIHETVRGLQGLHAYDSAGRTVLSEWAGTTGGDRQTEYAYDLAGNWIERSAGHCAGNFVVDPITHRYLSSPCEDYVHDVAGNRISTTATSIEGATRDFEYDHRNRLLRVTRVLADGSTRVREFRRDALGRVSEVREYPQGQPASATVIERRRYLDWTLLERDLVDEGDVYTYVVDDEHRVVRRTRENAGEQLYLFTDPRGSVIASILDDGTAPPSIEFYEYEDYGQRSIVDAFGVTLADSVVDLRIGLHGMEWDAFAELYDARTRMLDPRTGRFTSMDRAGVWADALAHGNPYVFAGNNPATYRDPTGTWCKPRFRKFTNESQKEKTITWVKGAERVAEKIHELSDEVRDTKKRKREARYDDTKILPKWFGIYKRRTRFTYLNKHIRKIHRRLANDRIKFRMERRSHEKCSERIDEGLPPAVAFTKRNGRHTIHVCRGLFDQNGLELDKLTSVGALGASGQSTIYHEVAHNSGRISDGDPSVYRTWEARDLAKSDEKAAKYTAANYEHASEDCWFGGGECR